MDSPPCYTDSGTGTGCTGCRPRRPRCRKDTSKWRIRRSALDTGDLEDLPLYNTTIKKQPQARMKSKVKKLSVVPITACALCANVNNNGKTYELELLSNNRYRIQRKTGMF